jgi:hypothetical protein
MQSGHGRCCCWLDRFFPVKVDRTSEPHWLPRSTARSERASRTGGSPQARGCPPGAIWLLNWAFPAAPCVRPTNVSLRSNSRLASGRQELVWLERQPLSSLPERSQETRLLPELFYEFGRMPLAFQMGVPAQDAFPFKLWSRIMTRETRRAAAAPVTYPDPRGDPELRKQIAVYLGARPRHSVQPLSGARHRRILRRAWSSNSRPSTRQDGKPGSRIQAFRSLVPRSDWLACV